MATRHVATCGPQLLNPGRNCPWVVRPQELARCLFLQSTAPFYQRCGTWMLTRSRGTLHVREEAFLCLWRKGLVVICCCLGFGESFCSPLTPTGTVDPRGIALLSPHSIFLSPAQKRGFSRWDYLRWSSFWSNPLVFSSSCYFSPAHIGPAHGASWLRGWKAGCSSLRVLTTVEGQRLFTARLSYNGKLVFSCWRQMKFWIPTDELQNSASLIPNPRISMPLGSSIKGRKAFCKSV